MAEEKITLHAYDISGGLAANLSQMFLGIPLEGVWHTGVVVYGKEYFFGGGIKAMPPETFWAAHNISGPTKTHDLGTTTKTVAELHAFLETIKAKYRIDNYDIFKNNCNNFSDDVVRFLKDVDAAENAIPDYIIDLPSKVLATPLGKSVIGPMLSSIKDGTALLGKSKNELQSFFGQSQGQGQPKAILKRPPNQGKAPELPKATIFKKGLKNYDSVYNTLVKAHGQEMVDFFEKMSKSKNIGSFEVCKRLIISTFDSDLKELTSKSKTFVLLFNKDNSEKEKAVIKEFLSERNIDGFEVNESEIENKEEIIDLGMSILESVENKEEKITILSQNANNLVLTFLIGYLLNIETYGVKKSLLTVSQVFKHCYVSFENLITLLEYCEVETKWIRMVEDLHVESKANILNSYLEPKVKEVMQLGLTNVDKEKALRVLKTTKGKVNAAANLLIS